jgi:hypothetical protein
MADIVIEAQFRIMLRTWRAGSFSQYLYLHREFMRNWEIARQGKCPALNLEVKHSHFRVAGSRGLRVAMAPTVRDNAARQIEMNTENRLKLWPDMHDRYRKTSISFKAWRRESHVLLKMSELGHLFLNPCI